MRTPIAFALFFAFLADAAPGRPPAKPDEMIRIRQGSELFMSWNMNRISDMVAERSKSFNKDEVIRAAQGVAAVANAGVASLYGPGTEKFVGTGKTRVKAEFFQQPEKARELMENFAAEANQLVKVAEGGEPAAIRVQVAKTMDTCKACHDNFRVKD